VRRWTRYAVLVGALCGAISLSTGPAAAAPGAEEPQAAASGPASDEAKAGPDAPAVPLDRLLRLPDSIGRATPEPRRGGFTRPEWEARFREAHAELETARKGLDQVQQQLEQEAGQVSNWQVAAPGQQAASENSPLSYKLSQEIRRRREGVEVSERRLQSLVVEANLAGIPEDWRP
jgi:hypothetical protein